MSLDLSSTERALRRSSQPSATRFAFFAVLALVASWPYLSTAGSMNSFRDAQVLLHYEDVARRSVLEHGQLPWWDPYYCGGMYVLGTPQARFAAPPFLLTLIFGSIRAESLTLFFMLLIGLEGTFRYLRARRARRLEAMLCAPVFALSGVFACAPFLGWTGFLGFALLPWSLLGTRLAARGSLRGAVLAAASFTFMAGFAGTYVVPLSAVACAGEAALGLYQARRLAGLLSLASLGLLAAGLAAFRLLPLLETLAWAPRLLGGTPGIEWSALGGLLFGYAPMFESPTWYLVGGGAAGVAAFSLLRRRALFIQMGVALTVWLALGYSIHPSLFAALRRLPVFEMLRSPERFLVVTALLAAVLACEGLTYLALRVRRPGRVRRLPWKWGWAVGAVVLLGNTLFLSTNFFVAAKSRAMVAAPVEQPGPFHQARGNRWALSEFMPMNLGSLSCWEAYPVPQSAALRADLPEEEYLDDPSAGEIISRKWSPNRIDLEVRASRPVRVKVNQNHHPGWRANVGQAVSADGLLAVDLPAGEHRLSLRFWPRSAVVGLVTTLASIVVALWLTRWRRGHWAALGFACVPLVLGATVWRVMPEPPFQIGASDKASVVADAPSDGARPINATFERGIHLDAAKLEAQADRHLLRLELDFRLEAPLPPTLGIFIHPEPFGMKRLTADHPMLSDALLLEEAPVGKTLRDVVWLSVPTESRGKVWTIWAGLWELRGDGSRLKVLDAGTEQVHENRVRVGVIEVP